jgi:hypothetical protein
MGIDLSAGIKLFNNSGLISKKNIYSGKPVENCFSNNPARKSLVPKIINVDMFFQ